MKMCIPFSPFSTRAVHTWLAIFNKQLFIGCVVPVLAAYGLLCCICVLQYFHCLPPTFSNPHGRWVTFVWCFCHWLPNLPLSFFCSDVSGLQRTFFLHNLHNCVIVEYCLPSSQVLSLCYGHSSNSHNDWFSRIFCLLATYNCGWLISSQQQILDVQRQSVKRSEGEWLLSVLLFSVQVSLWAIYSFTKTTATNQQIIITELFIWFLAHPTLQVSAGQGYSSKNYLFYRLNLLIVHS